MVSVEDAVIAKLFKDNKEFEILVDGDKALELRKGANISIENILAVRGVFKDARKGERASEKDIGAVFGTTDELRVAEAIIRKGDVQLTTEKKRELIEEKRKQIANIISRQGVNPQNKLPHPPTRVMNAMEQAKVNIDPFRPAENQVEKVLEAIRPIIPISFERVEIAIKIPVRYAGKASSIVRGMAPVKKEEWGSAYWIALIEIPAGMQSNVYDKLNELTSGEADIKVVKRIEV